MGTKIINGTLNVTNDIQINGSSVVTTLDNITIEDYSGNFDLLTIAAPVGMLLEKISVYYEAEDQGYSFRVVLDRSANTYTVTGDNTPTISGALVGNEYNWINVALVNSGSPDLTLAENLRINYAIWSSYGVNPDLEGNLIEQ